MIFWRNANKIKSIALTLGGSTSAVMINGNGRIPKQLINTNVEKLTNGIQFTVLKSMPDVLRYEYVPKQVRPRNAPDVENNNNTRRPTRSTRFVAQYTPIICMPATIIADVCGSKSEPDASNILAV